MEHLALFFAYFPQGYLLFKIGDNQYMKCPLLREYPIN